ncbi:transposase [Streptomyces sp. SM11]|uniref:transposase n=1 Tax=Streptomyces sp. SM11 TaxID=565557 RepID=UPI002156201C|nr:transposase [Streptomyces sp. SM11]
MWNDPEIQRPNPDARLPETEISAVHRSDDSGTTQAFIAYLADAAPEEWPYEKVKVWQAEGGHTAPGSDGVVSTVSLTLSVILEIPGAAAWSTGMLGRSRRPMQLLRCPLSMSPRSGEHVPSLTAQIARASNPDGTTAMWVRDRLEGLWCDEDFADWYPRDGRPGFSPAQLATVCVLQFLLGLSDRQAAETVRCRIDFKYAMAMELDDRGFHHSVLGDFRDRLTEDGRADRLLDLTGQYS